MVIYYGIVISKSQKFRTSFKKLKIDSYFFNKEVNFQNTFTFTYLSVFLSTFLPPYCVCVAAKNIHNLTVCVRVCVQACVITTSENTSVTWLYYTSLCFRTWLWIWQWTFWLRHQQWFWRWTAGEHTEQEGSIRETAQQDIQWWRRVQRWR